MILFLRMIRWFKPAFTLLRRAAQAFARDNCTLLAAAISYYFLFSIFPLLIFLTGVLGVVLQSSELREDLIEAVLESVPLSEEEGRADVSRAFREIGDAGSGVIGAFGLLGMAWSGSAAFAAVRRSINIVYAVDQPRPLVQQKLLDLAMVLATGAFFLLSIAATGLLRTSRQLASDIPVVSEAAAGAGLGWDILSYAVPFALSLLAFTVLYCVVPATRTRPKDVWPGALVAALLFEIGKLGFSIYIENFASYDIVYGSLGAVTAFLFWVYLSANIMLFGAEVASEHRRELAGAYANGAEPASQMAFDQRIRKLIRGLFIREKDNQAAGVGDGHKGLR
jgi:membrane protein